MENATCKVLITGNAGFIFSHVTDHMLNRGYTVVGVDNLSLGSHPELVPGWRARGLTQYTKDVASDDFATIVEYEAPDYIIHAAAYSDVDGSITSPFEIMKNNIIATMNVFEAARKLPNLKKVLYIDTDEIFGECEYPKTEYETLFPRNPYAASKAMGVFVRTAYDNSFATLTDKTTETRFCNVIGMRQDPRKVLPRIVEAINTGYPMRVHNGGGGYREYIWVKDIPEIVERILVGGNRVYNITSGVGMTVNVLIDTVERISGKVVPRIDGVRPGMDTRYAMSAARVTNEFQLKVTPFEEGLEEYLRANQLLA